jgi:hypothetical protein
MRRRRLLGTVGVGVTAGLAGCSSLFQTTTGGREPPLVENRPAATYIPTHHEGMEMLGMAMAGDLRVALTYSYPHRFWVVEQEEDGFGTRRIDVGPDDAIHLMASVWDAETGMVIPTTGVSVEVTNADGFLEQEVVYSMLSQRMGVHYGGNFPLDGDGSYTAEVQVGGVSADRYGAFADRFGEPATAEIEFEYSEAERNDIPYQLYPDEQGQRGAAPAMEMSMDMGMGTEAMPLGRTADLPGESLGSGTTGDARFRASRIDADRFGGPYLAVTAGTPYHEFVLPGMGLRATVTRDGESVFSGRLRAALDPDAGFHYGGPVAELQAGDQVTLTVETPPVAARHEGYETAFLSMPDVTLSK